MLSGAATAASWLAEIAETEPDAAAYAAREAAELPDADPAWDWIWHAWWRLHATDRPHVSVGLSAPLGGAVIVARPLPLPWTLLRTWADRAGYSEDTFELFDASVSAMDGVFLSHWTETNKIEG